LNLIQTVQTSFPVLRSSNRTDRKPTLWTRLFPVALLAASLAIPAHASNNNTILDTGTLPAASASAPTGESYRLRLHHLHTGESIDVVYRVGNTYMPDAMAKLNYFLRDHRTNDVSHYDPKEFDVLHNVLTKLGKSESVIDVVCGYRTPWSNNFLRTLGGKASPTQTGVAKNSQHMLAKAIDIRIPGVATARLRDVALSLAAGGVGYYPISQFVHVDVGPVRTWSFFGKGDN
jgi:uncharacterized protein YcbK (DUF882 family)